MTRVRSLRRLLIVGATAFGVAAIALMVGVILLFVTLSRNYDREMQASLTEQRGVDEIVTSVYGQLLASYHQLNDPGARNMERFQALGDSAHARLRDYLYQPMTLEARLQVETIKDLHQVLEVDAHRAFELIRRGEAVAARTRVAEMEGRTAQLEAEMDRFAAIRQRDRTQRHATQIALLQKILVAFAVVVLALVVNAVLFVRLIRRHVARPLGQISEGAIRLGRGDLAVRIPEQRHVELATVARSFNEMAANMQAARVEIERQNTELSEAFVNLKHTQQELVQQEKLGAIGFMLAGLAHELNNPLAGILGSAQVIEQEFSKHPDPAIRAFVSEVATPLVGEARRAGDLVRNLLQFSRKSATELGIVNLKAAIDVAAGLRAYAFAQGGKDLRLDVPATLFVRVEAQRLEHVALNIMSNALDAMRTGGGTALTVRARAAADGMITLEFEDDGPGLREPERVFDAFYTTKRVGAGTGLGLTLVHRFVTEAGGTVSVANMSGRGACVTIRLPAVAEAEAHASMLRRTPVGMPAISAVPLSERTVLVVDDEPSVREVQRRFLSKLGLRVVLAKDGAEAIGLLEREKCDAVITDIRMPGEVDGIALYKWIERSQPHLATRCMFVTGDIGDWTDKSVISAHPNRVLTKPFVRDEYIGRVIALLDG